MSALADYRMFWRAAVGLRLPGLIARSYGIILACMLVVGGVSAAVTHDWASALYHSMNAALVVLAVYFATIFVPGAALLNTPAHARLVPRARRRLMQMTALGWLAIALVPALELGSSFIHVFLLFAAVGLSVVGLALAQGGYAPGACLPVLMPMAASYIEPRLEAANGPVLMATAAVALLAFAAFALQAIFPRGGDRHWSVHARVLRSAARATGEGQFNAAASWRPGLALYAAALRRDCARRRAAALLLHVLGPRAHWTQLVLPLIGLVAAAVVAKMLLSLDSGIDSLSPAGLIGWTTFLIMLMLVQVFNLERVAARLAATRAEQALLRMAPLTAPVRDFNRQLGHALLRYALLNWAAVTLTVMGLTALSGASTAAIVMHASLCCLGLPPVAAVLRDHAHHAGVMGWGFVLAAFASVLASAAVGLLATRMGLPGWPAMALASVVIALLAVRFRWRAMLAAPPAFPVGRLA